jgi:hypothetical protein
MPVSLPTHTASHAGLRQERSPCLFVARVGLFDRARNRFLGNILGVRPEAVTNKDGTWAFKPHVSVMCA